MSDYGRKPSRDRDREPVVEAPPAVTRIVYVGVGLRPDPKYSSLVVGKLINSIMSDGKKVAATDVVYGALEIVGRKITDRNPVEVLETAINNVKPRIEVRSKRVGGSTYQIPHELKPRRQEVLAFRWIKEAFRGKKGRSSAAKLANEILDAFNQQGTAMATRENTHKMAEANRAFAYYA